VASLSQGRTAAAQCGLFTYKSVPVIFEPPCTLLPPLGRPTGGPLYQVIEWSSGEGDIALVKNDRVFLVTLM